MNSFYNLIDTIKGKLEESDFNNKVTFGDITDVDLEKQTSFPLAHIIVNNVTAQEQVLLFNITVMAMDIVDESKKETTDIFVGNNNEQDVLNTQLAVLNKLQMVLRRGTLYSDKFQLEGDATLEPFYERFDNRLAGYAATMNVIIHNDIDIC